MGGYIGITAREWFIHLSQEEALKEVNFWRKDTRNFKSLEIGETFFFLVKNKKGIRGQRPVLGKAVFRNFEVLSVEEAWNKYETNNGDKDKESFLKRMNEMFKIDSSNVKIGCIILSDFQSFEKEVYLNDIDIIFENSVQTGKKITEKEVNALSEYSLNRIPSITNKLREANSLLVMEDDLGFPEGKVLLKKHLVRERNSKVIKLAKEKYFQQYGKLICEVCGFDFNQHYGKIGEGYIEGHHIKPISELDEDDETRVEDIALVCSNCHRMLHRRRPWLKISELEKLISQKSL